MHHWLKTTAAEKRKSLVLRMADNEVIIWKRDDDWEEPYTTYAMESVTGVGRLLKYTSINTVGRNLIFLSQSSVTTPIPLCKTEDKRKSRQPDVRK